MTQTTTQANNLYAIESAYDRMHIVSEMMDMPIHVTELLQGRHWSATASRNEREATQWNPNDWVQILVEDFGDPQRHEEDITVLFEQRLDFMLYHMFMNAGTFVDTITVRGVYLDPAMPPNKYNVPGPEVRLFDIEFNGKPLNASAAFLLFSAYAVKHVPVLSFPNQTLYGWLNQRPLPKAAEDLSRLANTQRLGLVIRPIIEHDHPEIGRLILKAESAKKDELL